MGWSAVGVATCGLFGDIVLVVKSSGRSGVSVLALGGGRSDTVSQQGVSLKVRELAGSKCISRFHTFNISTVTLHRCSNPSQHVVFQIIIAIAAEAADHCEIPRHHRRGLDIDVCAGGNALRGHRTGQIHAFHSTSRFARAEKRHDGVVGSRWASVAGDGAAGEEWMGMTMSDSRCKNVK